MYVRKIDATQRRDARTQVFVMQISRAKELQMIKVDYRFLHVDCGSFRCFD